MEHQFARSLLEKLERECRMMDPEREPSQSDPKQDVALKRLKVGRHD